MNTAAEKSPTPFANTRSVSGGAVASVLIGLILAALDQTVVVTALPSMIGQLGRLDLATWVFSAYMIAELSTMLIAGKLADRFGRKRLFLVGVAIFLIGSALCGMASSMEALIACRFLQGIGGGALTPTAFTLIFEMFPPQRQHFLQGLLSGVFALAAMVGPLLGAFLTVHWGWHSVFFVNLPFGVVSMVVLSLTFHEVPWHLRVLPPGVETPQHRHDLPFDIWGMVWLVGSVVSLLLCVEIAVSYGLAHLGATASGIVFVVCMAFFLRTEGRATDPLVDLGYFRDWSFSAAQVCNFLFGAVMMAPIVFVPLFVQGVQAASPEVAGRLLAPMMISVAAGSAIGGRLVEKFSFRGNLLISCAFLLPSQIVLAMISPTSGTTAIQFALIAAGIGVGLSFPVLFLVTLQHTPLHARASGNSLVMFFRTLGSGLGVALLGLAQIAHLRHHVAAGGDNIWRYLHDFHAVFQPELRAALSAAALGDFTTALSASVGYVFLWSSGLSLLIVICTWAMGSKRLDPVRLGYVSPPIHAAADSVELQSTH
ncbi:MAG: MFS transporter [Verrucomicrobia bacterium]|nr:MFS transporter [Verrucomicrobiota bacterium]